jgi:LPS-assembly lipoprotein
MAHRLSGIALAVLGAASLSACGFTPLYATPGVSPALSGIEVDEPLSDQGVANREGYLLKVKLNNELAHDAETPSRYRLATTVKVNRYSEGARVNNIASRYELAMTVSYVLSDRVTGAVLTKGSVPVQVSYDSSSPPYAGVAASQDGEARAAEQAAIRLRLDLSHYFASQADGN